MPDYQKGKVYRILQDGTKTVYIGSTTQELSARMGQHRKGLVNYPNMKLYKLMAEVGVDRFTIELIVDVPCDRREILNRAEGEQIRLHGTITDGCNQNVAGRNAVEYRQIPEVKAKRAALWQTPEVKAKDAARKQTPEYKAKAAARMQTPEYKTKQVARQQNPEYKARAAARKQTLEVKARTAAYNQTHEVKAKRAARKQTLEYKAKAAAYEQLPEVKAQTAARHQTPEYKAKAAARRQTPEFKAKRAEYMRLKRAAAVEAAPVI